MRVRMTKAWPPHPRPLYDEGAEVELPDADGQMLIDGGHAELVAEARAAHAPEEKGEPHDGEKSERHVPRRSK